MPELPEVEAVCQRIRRHVRGLTILEAQILRTHITRPQDPSEIVRMAAGRRIDDIRRMGKNILLLLSGDVALHIHLRMTGNLTVIPDYRLRPLRSNAWFRLEDNRALVFEDPRALGTLRLADLGALAAEVGIEPLSRRFTFARFLEMAKQSRQPAKIFLMDQRHIAGLGNIYAAEALFEASIDPRKPLARLRPDRLQALHASIVRVLRTALESAQAAYSRPDAFSEGEWYPVAVYGREGEPCPRCHRRVRRIAQGGRSTYFCPTCQR
ncbi:MAG: bifunctional DNA-formamidopyrimidine glycosylase/DNA-(apurinic or apyrimidinic site) lyase [Bryobacteraceae bacterium]